MCGLRESLGIDGSTESEGDALTENLGVSQSGDTLVVDLGLDERLAVKLVLAGNLESDTTGVSALGVPGGLGTGLNLRVHAVVVRRGEDVEVVGGGDGSSVLGDGVSNGGRVLGDLSSADVVTNLGTGNEAVMSDNGVTVEGRTLQQIEEGASVEQRLAEVEVELGTLALGGGKELGKDLGLEAVGNGVVKLNLGVESIEGGPCLGQDEA